MPLIQGIDGGVLLNALRQGRSDRRDDDLLDLKRKQFQLESDRQKDFNSIAQRIAENRRGISLPGSQGGVAGATGFGRPGGGVMGQVRGAAGIVATPEQEAESARMAALFPDAPALAPETSALGETFMPRVDAGTQRSIDRAAGFPVTPVAGRQSNAPAGLSNTGEAARPPANLGASVRDNSNDELYGKLLALDPEQAGKLITGMKNLDEATFNAQRRRNDMLGSAALYLRKFPAQQRAARLQMIAPQMIDAGWSEDEISNADLSDEALFGYQAFSVDFDRLYDNELADRRLAADEANMHADNARADRNTDSLIEDRRGRRAETRRYNDMRDSTVRRGQDRRGSREKLPIVQSPTEAAKLPSGTRFRTPDGQVRIVP